MDHKQGWLYIVLGVLILLILFCTTVGRSTINTWLFGLKKTDDATQYETRRKVEEACRSMIASWTNDKLTYEMYKDSDNEEKRSWGEQARMRANKTAASYNEYVLKNSFVWDGNIPKDLRTEIPYL